MACVTSVCFWQMAVTHIKTWILSVYICLIVFSKMLQISISFLLLNISISWMSQCMSTSDSNKWVRHTSKGKGRNHANAFRFNFQLLRISKPNPSRNQETFLQLPYTQPPSLCELTLPPHLPLTPRGKFLASGWNLDHNTMLNATHRNWIVVLSQAHDSPESHCSRLSLI